MTVEPIWEPPAFVPLENILELDHRVGAIPDLPIDIREDLFHIRVLEMDWDIGVVIYQPRDPSKIPSGPDGNKVGVFLLHGGVSDFKSV